MKNAALLLLFAPIMLSCGGASVSSSESQPAFVEPTLEEGEAAAYVHDGEAKILWNAPDYDGYRIYGCASKYGEYKLLSGEELIRKSRYEAASNRYGFFKIAGVNGEKEEFFCDPVSAFGDEALIIDMKDDMNAVQEEIEDRHSRLETARDGQFSSERFAAFFLPGEYESITMKLGYYSSAYGLGKVPDDTLVHELFVSTEVLSNDNSTCTFWRNAENLSFPLSTQFAVSQATSLRRCHFKQNLYLSSPSGWSSGGFLADSKVDGRVDSRTQQQWYSRNVEMGQWNGSSHNYVFSGCTGRLPQHSWTENTSRTSIEEKTSVMAEAPFLYDTGSEYRVFIPAIRRDSVGLSYSEESMGEGKSIPLDDFYLANDNFDNDRSLNDALSKGKSILFTPGIYHLEEPLKVTSPNTILLGTGYATLQVSDNNRFGALDVADVDGVRISNILLDAGHKSTYLARIGEAKSEVSHAENPIVISDFFCRIGGKENVHTEVKETLLINSNDVIGDNYWLWRADHSRGVAWEDYEDERGNMVYGNPSDTGIRVEGDNVTCHALMVEHYERYQTIWNGENGKVVMYQCEVPYNVPEQEAWDSHNGTVEGHASYKVGDNVKKHYALGLGVYWVHYTHDFLDHAFEVPVNDGVIMEHLVTTTFSGNETGGIRHVINDYGGAVGEGGIFRQLVDKYPVQAE